MFKNKKKRFIFFCFSLTVFFSLSAQKFEELALTPQMGWSSWNAFKKNIDEDLIRQMADIMAEEGFLDAGYCYLNIDDGWARSRDSLGFILADPEKFPSGIAALAQYVHHKGLKFGIYSSAGPKTCGGLPGSLGHEYQDAIIYAKWGVDYLKYDWCAASHLNPRVAYPLMADAIREAGRPMVFSICDGGPMKPWLWAGKIGHSWRTTYDIWPCFSCIKDHGSWKQPGVLPVIDQQDSLRKYAGPGHWNDPDMMQIGNGELTLNQNRAHFSMWCMLAAPLLLGTDLRKMSPELKEVVLNKEVIAIDQDSLGIQAMKYKNEEGVDFWFKPLCNGAWALCLLNRSNAPVSIDIDWNDIAFFDEVSQRDFNSATQLYTIRNLWTKKMEGKTRKVKKVTLPAEDVMLYHLTPM